MTKTQIFSGVFIVVLFAWFIGYMLGAMIDHNDKLERKKEMVKIANGYSRRAEGFLLAAQSLTALFKKSGNLEYLNESEQMLRKSKQLNDSAFYYVKQVINP